MNKLISLPFVIMSMISVFVSSKRNVPACSFTLHVAHCERFMQICSKCQEPVNRTQMELHEKDVHSLINCKDCHQQIEKGLHDEHIVSNKLIPISLTLNQNLQILEKPMSEKIDSM